jgi:hypothetical protein
MKYMIVAAALAFLSACGVAQTQDQPSGRYEAVPAQTAGVWVLDTKTGSLRYCATSSQPGESPDMGRIAVACMPPTDAGS